MKSSKSSVDDIVDASQTNTWWRNGMVWLVIAGPAVVVVAALATAVIAYRGADVVIIDTASSRHVPTQPTSETPALQARNHAATAATR